MIDWSDAKNDQLKAERGIDLEEIANAIERDEILAILPNPAHPGQIIFVVCLHGYACACPAVQEGDGYFLKTAYFSRKLHNRFIGGES